MDKQKFTHRPGVVCPECGNQTVYHESMNDQDECRAAGCGWSGRIPHDEVPA